MLYNFSLPYSENAHEKSFIFQQCGASVHLSNTTLECLADWHIDVLEWPAYSPDLNPIENLWDMLARRIYRNNLQFDTVLDLQEAFTGVPRSEPIKLR